MWGGCFGGILERMRGSDDVDLAIRTELVHEAIEKRRFGEWFVALDINNELELTSFADDFGDAIRPALMLR